MPAAVGDAIILANSSFLRSVDSDETSSSTRAATTASQPLGESNASAAPPRAGTTANGCCGCPDAGGGGDGASDVGDDASA